MARNCFAASLLVLALVPAAAFGSNNPSRHTVSQQAPQSGAQTSASLAPGENLAALSAAELEARGDASRARKEYLNAIDYYRVALKKAPTAALHNKLAMAFILMGRPGDAKKELDRATRMEPTNPSYWNNLGVTFYMRKKYLAAIKDFRRAIELNPDEASFHNSLGTTYMDNKEYGLAAVEYRRALELDPGVFERSSPYGVSGRLTTPEDVARYNFEMARLFASLGDNEHALHCLRRALEDGYPRINDVYKDKEFTKLRSDERFTALMKDRPPALPHQ